jgi:hypothetical protein
MPQGFNQRTRTTAEHEDVARERIAAKALLLHRQRRQPTGRRQNSALYDWSSGARQLDLKLISVRACMYELRNTAARSNISTGPYR